MTNPTSITAEPGLPFVDIVRSFRAPVSSVFQAHTDRDLFSQWMGPRETTLDVSEFDATTGGRWAYRASSGEMLLDFRGVFHTVEPDALIVQTFEFDGAPGQVGISATTFELVDGGTRLSVREVYPSVGARNMAMASGMEYGINEGYERLDELLATQGSLAPGTRTTSAYSPYPSPAALQLRSASAPFPGTGEPNAALAG